MATKKEEVRISGLSATKAQREAELKRVTKISGFAVGYHALLAEIDLDALKRRNDRWEEEHGSMTQEERMMDELERMGAYVAAGKAAGHIAIHVHAAHECGATPQEIYRRILRASGWGGSAECYQTGLEAWRMIFMPDFPTVFRIVELTSDSLQ